MDVPVTHSADCKNSPKNLFAETLAVQLVTGAVAPLTEVLTQDVELEIAGKQTVSGKDAALQAIEQGLCGAVSAVDMEFALSHGRSGAANGRAKVGEEWGPFCAMLRFENTKANRVRIVRFFA